FTARKMAAPVCWGARDQPYCESLLPQLGLAAPDTQRIVERIAAVDNIVCVSGPLAPTGDMAALQSLATRLAAPLLADINSGLRCHGQQASVLALYNFSLRRPLSP